MNDPHVEELVYHIETGEGLNFQGPPPVEDETDAFRMILEDGVVTFFMKEHHPTEQSARQAVGVGSQPVVKRHQAAPTGRPSSIATTPQSPGRPHPSTRRATPGSANASSSDGLRYGGYIASWIVPS